MTVPCCWAKLMHWPCTCGQKITKHDERQLAELVAYASGIYRDASGVDPHPDWKPSKDVGALLSQLSNILRGIRDEIPTTAPPRPPANINDDQIPERHAFALRALAERKATP